MKSTKASKKPATSSSNVFRMPEGIFNRIRETVQSIKNTTQTSMSKQTSNLTTQSKITTMFGDASQPSSSRGTKTTLKKHKYDEPKLRESSNIEATHTYDDKDTFSLFETTSFIDDVRLNFDFSFVFHFFIIVFRFALLQKPHRSYSRVTKREPKRQYEFKSFLADDRSEFGESVIQKRTKRTKPKDNKHEVSQIPFFYGSEFSKNISD